MKIDHCQDQAAADYQHADLAPFESREAAQLPQHESLDHFLFRQGRQNAGDGMAQIAHHESNDQQGDTVFDPGSHGHHDEHDAIGAGKGGHRGHEGG